MGHPRFETAPGKQAQVDWKEDIRMISKQGVVHEFHVLNYKLGCSIHSVFKYSHSLKTDEPIEKLIMAFKEQNGVPLTICLIMQVQLLFYQLQKIIMELIIYFMLNCLNIFSF